MRTDARRNYERLLTAARTVFADEGIDAPLDKIAKLAGVGPGTLYRHFPTRKTLLLAVFQDRISELADEANQLRRAASNSPDDQEAALTTWLGKLAEYTRENRGLGAALTLTPDRMSDYHKRLYTAAEDLVAGAQRSGRVRVDLDVADLLTLVKGIAVVAERMPGDPDLARRPLALTMEGLRA